MNETPVNRYAEDRADFAAAYRAAIDTILDALAASTSYGPGPEPLSATRHMVDSLVTVLAIHDRISRRAEEWGAEPETVSRPREDRTELVMHLRRAVEQLQRLEQGGDAPL